MHLFWRGRDRSPFTYAGLANVAEVGGGSPVQVIWDFEEQSPSHAGPSVEQTGDPPWRRGPAPTFGPRVMNFRDGAAHVYIMTLTGDVRAIFPDAQDGVVVIKVGRANDPGRRLKELNMGFPPGSALRWVLHHTVFHASTDQAHEHEDIWLEHLREKELWIGGEFPKLNSEQLKTANVSLSVRDVPSGEALP